MNNILDHNECHRRHLNNIYHNENNTDVLYGLHWEPAGIIHFNYATLNIQSQGSFTERF